MNWREKRARSKTHPRQSREKGGGQSVLVFTSSGIISVQFLSSVKSEETELAARESNCLKFMNRICNQRERLSQIQTQIYVYVHIPPNSAASPFLKCCADENQASLFTVFINRF